MTSSGHTLETADRIDDAEALERDNLFCACDAGKAQRRLRENRLLGWRQFEESSANMAAQAKQRTIASVFEGAGVPARFQGVTLKGLTAIAGDDIRKRMALNAAAEYYRSGHVVSGDVRKRSILVWGPCGVGKTGCLVPLFNHLVTQNRGGLFISFQSLVEQIESGYDQSNTAYQRLNEAKLTPVLFLDDFGYSYRNDVSPHVIKVVNSIIYHRHSYDMPTLFTSNMSPDELESQIGPANWQRVGEMARVIEMSGRVLRSIG